MPSARPRGGTCAIAHCKSTLTCHPPATHLPEQVSGRSFASELQVNNTRKEQGKRRLGRC